MHSKKYRNPWQVFIFIFLFANVAVSTATSTQRHKARKKNAYVAALCRELDQRKDYLQGERIETIYLGGGTPSQLEDKDFEQIFQTLHRLYDISPEAEITIEANPDDLTDEYVNMLRTFPFNRLSMGIQTFQEIFCVCFTDGTRHSRLSRPSNAAGKPDSPISV